MAKLAIKGHPTRGEEVIEILEMLGGKNNNLCCGEFIGRIYFINENGYIEGGSKMHKLDYLQLTLEEFLKKFPYKIGDKILYKTYGIYSKIKTMLWNEEKEQVFYRLESNKLFVATADELQPRKEETIENKLDLLQQLKDYFDNTPREVVEKEWHEYDKYNEIGPTVDEYLEYVNKIRQPEYPKTFIECCEILYPNENFQTVSQPIKGHNGKKLFILQKLLICRDAYWKIAGEQMELDKPWEYDMSKDEFSYAMSYQYGYIQKNEIRHKNAIFAFPTAEIRDAFKENFDDDIEFCKEFL